MKRGNKGSKQGIRLRCLSCVSNKNTFGNPVLSSEHPSQLEGFTLPKNGKHILMFGTYGNRMVSAHANIFVVSFTKHGRHLNVTGIIDKFIVLRILHPFHLEILHLVHFPVHENYHQEVRLFLLLEHREIPFLFLLRFRLRHHMELV